MPVLEAGLAVIRGSIIRENAKIPFPVDAYYDVVFLPGFSDAHAHPQVVDAGLYPGAKWRSSYEWLLYRRMSVDEALVRADIGLSSRLAELALKRALLEGTTLIAFTGRFEANLKAFTRLSGKPRLVVLPTVMKRRGWYLPSQVEEAYRSYSKFMKDRLLRAGVFVHSIAYGGPDLLEAGLRLARRIRGPFGIHLSEGVSEKGEFEKLTCCIRDNVRIVAVHCLDDDYRSLGVRCASCPASNLILYSRYLGKLERATSFGSDWPHLVGTVGRLLPVLRALYRGREREYLYRATIGGYLDYGVAWNGDIVAYNGSLSSILEGRSLPNLVAVAGKIVVSEGRLVDTGESIRDIERETLEVIEYASEVYGDGDKPIVPGLDELLERARSAARAGAVGGETRIAL